MAEYIERETLLKRLCDMCENEYCKAQKAKRGAEYSECLEFDLIVSEPPVDVAPVQKWISVKDRLPEPEQEVIVCCKSQISNSKYVSFAFYVPENWLRESSQFSWDYECCDEYDEEQDDYVVNKGWYEPIHNWDEYSVIGIDDAVTHWMPLQEPTKEDNNCKES